MVVKIVNPLLAKRVLFNVFVANIYWDYFFLGERSDFRGYLMFETPATNRNM